MDIEFVCDMFAVGDDGVCRDTESVGYLFVAQSFDDVNEDFAFTVGESVFGVECLAVESRCEDVSFYGAMVGEILFGMPEVGHDGCEPVEFFGQKFSGFTYVEGTDVFTAMDNSNVSLGIIYPTLAELVSENWWSVTYSGLGATGKQYWDILGQVQDLLGETLYYAIFGTFDGNFGITFNSGGYWGSLLYVYQTVSDDEIAILYQGGNSSDNGAWYVQNAYYGTYMAGPFGRANEVHVYKLTADDPFNPSWILMTDEEDPDNTITLYSGAISYPLNN